MAEKVASCPYEIDKGPNGGNLKCHCGECPNAANLKDKKCLHRVLKALDREFGITSVTLAHHVETQYTGESMELLERMLFINRILERMGGRNPEPNGKGGPDCNGCKLNPGNAFPSLSERFTSDMASFHKEFRDVSLRLNANAVPQCRACVKQTKGDLLFLSKHIVPFWRWVASRGEEH